MSDTHGARTRSRHQYTYKPTRVMAWWGLQHDGGWLCDSSGRALIFETRKQARAHQGAHEHVVRVGAIIEAEAKDE